MTARILFAAIAAATILCAQQPSKKAKQGLESGWGQWLKEDVAYIISDEERKAFNQLNNDEEREQFVEQFWLRRDPSPDTEENEYKEEHYRRIAYANEHFASGIPGWRTDRGRIYIRYGAPDEIESHPSGGSYQRPASLGGGETSTFPFELWRYRHLDTAGEDVVIEFVDPTMSGEYHVTIDPCEKDALTNVPNAGLSQAELMGLSTKLARFQNTDGTHCPASLGGKAGSEDEFSRLQRLADIERAPTVRFKDLEAVTTGISFNVLPLKVQVDYLRVTEASVRVNVTLQFDNRDLEFASHNGVMKARLEVLGRVWTLTRRPAAHFEVPFEAVAPAALNAEYAKMRSVLQQSVMLSPGKYRLELIAKDASSGIANRLEIPLEVPRYDEQNLSSGSLILADKIEPLPRRSAGGAMFAIADRQVRPRVGAQFSQSEKLGLYLQLYNLGVQPAGRIHYEITAANGGKKAEADEIVSGSQATIEKLLPLRDFSPGEYAIKVNVSANGQQIERKARFTVTP